MFASNSGRSRQQTSTVSCWLKVVQKNNERGHYQIVKEQAYHCPCCKQQTTAEHQIILLPPNLSTAKQRPQKVFFQFCRFFPGRLPPSFGNSSHLPKPDILTASQQRVAQERDPQQPFRFARHQPIRCQTKSGAHFISQAINRHRGVIYACFAPRQMARSACSAARSSGADQKTPPFAVPESIKPG